MEGVAESSGTDRTPLIVKDEDTVGGCARISGTRVRVSDVFLRYRAGESPEEIAQAFDLGLEQVHDALSYYFGNQEEIQEELSEREKAVEESQERHKSKL